ncbi:TnsA endonuclease N-terminal domain-containing protein [Pelagibius sp. 7325]|uniref:TnsA endonuclease N-terminal domain-containing protein n=1 Tax=Pelagibius sp. 7325 TaxID=3131994 RepID=UPI0030EE7E99
MDDHWEYDRDPHGRDRKVTRPTGVINRIVFPSVKMMRQIHCEGDNERNAVALMEVHPRIATYREQPPLDLRITIAGRVRKVFPDFELTYRDGSSEIIDVVRARTLLKADKREKMRRIGAICRERGFKYRLWTDLDIERQPRLSGANEICRRGRKSLSDQLIARAIRMLPECQTVGALNIALGGQIDTTCALVLQGHLAVDISQGLNDRTPILGHGWRSDKL